MDRELEAYVKDVNEAMEALSHCDKNTPESILKVLIDRFSCTTHALEQKMKREFGNNEV